MRYQYTSNLMDVTITQELDSLINVSAVKSYMEAHMKIWQRAPSNFNATYNMVQHIFMRNIKPYLYMVIENIQWNSLINSFSSFRTYAEWLTICMDTILKVGSNNLNRHWSTLDFDFMILQIRKIFKHMLWSILFKGYLGLRCIRIPASHLKFKICLTQKSDTL